MNGLASGIGFLQKKLLIINIIITIINIKFIITSSSGNSSSSINSSSNSVVSVVFVVEVVVNTTMISSISGVVSASIIGRRRMRKKKKQEQEKEKGEGGESGFLAFWSPPQVELSKSYSEVKQYYHTKAKLLRKILGPILGLCRARPLCTRPLCRGRRCFVFIFPYFSVSGGEGVFQSVD